MATYHRAMPVLRSRLDPAARRDAARTTTRWRRSSPTSATRQAAVAGRGAGGDERSIARHRERGKLPVRERIERLLDPGSAFLELSPLAATGLYDDDAPGAGIVTGDRPGRGHDLRRRRQRRDGQGRHLLPDDGQEAPPRPGDRAREPAAVHLPRRFSGGAFLPLQAEVFPDRDHFGRIFYNQARMSAAGIPQVALVMGSCTAGGAYVPAMSDETVIVRGTGTIFLGGPPLVKAATGEDVTPEELGGAEVHTRRSGVADHEALDDEHALALGRSIVANLNRKTPDAAVGPARARAAGGRPGRRRRDGLAVRRGLGRPAPAGRRSARSSPGSSTAAASTSSSRSTARRW